MPIVGDVASILAECQAAHAAVVRRLRHMTEARLTGRAEIARSLSATLAVAAQGIEEAASPSEPAWRAVPAVGIFALGDQVAVLGHDLLAAATGRYGSEPAWTPSGRRPLEDVLAAVRSALDDAREAL